MLAALEWMEMNMSNSLYSTSAAISDSERLYASALGDDPVFSDEYGPFFTRLITKFWLKSRAEPISQRSPVWLSVRSNGKPISMSFSNTPKPL